MRAQKFFNKGFWSRYSRKRQREWDSAWYKSLRRRVFTRDKYTCALTGKRGGELHLHHIKRYYDFPKLRFDPRNLITLSKAAHDSIKDREYVYTTALWKIAQKREKEWLKIHGKPSDTVSSKCQSAVAKTKRPVSGRRKSINNRAKRSR